VVPITLKLSRVAAAAALLAVAFAARPAAAQRDMYGMGGNSASDAHGQFVAEARQKVGALIADYESAWGSHDLRALMRLYGENAIVYPAEGGMLQGRDAVQGYFGKLLPSVQPLHTRIIEFKTAGELAFATLQVVYSVKDGSADRPVNGTEVVVFRRDWADDWTIVTHFIREDAPAGANAAATAAQPQSSNAQ
jgi:uncharacterized protein (TIGR02246 family)